MIIFNFFFFLNTEAEGYKRELTSKTAEIARLNEKINQANDKNIRLLKKIEVLKKKKTPEEIFI